MQPILADVTVSISEYKRNPAAVLWAANNRPVAVLNRNRIAFYMVEQFFQAMLEELLDQDLYLKAARRLAEKARAVEVSIDEL